MRFPKTTLFMAIAKGNASTDAVKIKRYIGIGSCKVLAVNPNAAQVKALLGYEPQEEPVYYGTQEIDGKNIPYARISFVISTIPELCNGVECTQMLTYFVRNQYRKGAQTGKYQVIDEYGRTAWAAEETIKAKQQIMYANGPANISANYRPAYVGEAELTEFLRIYLNIANPATYLNGTWTMKSPEEAKLSECRLDNITEYFKGNIAEIKDAIALQPNNKVKVLFGIRVNDEGREYQDIYPTVVRNNASSYEKLQKEIEDRKEHGGLSNRVYEFCNIKEYRVIPTDMSEAAVVEDPFANAGTVEETPWG